MEMGRDVKSVVKYWMEGEVTNFIKVWTLACISLCYCYFAAKLVQKGAPRLFSLLPVVCLFFLLPLSLHSINLGGTTGFFLAWLANFKLLLLAFGRGPLSDPSISLPRFLALACFPVNVQNSSCRGETPTSQEPHFQETPKEKTDLYTQNQTFQENPHQQELEKSHLSPQNAAFQESPHPESQERSDLSPQNWNFSVNPSAERLKSPPKFVIYAVKALLLSLMIQVYNYSEHRQHKTMTKILYVIFIYIYLEIILSILADMTSGILGLNLEPQFKDPLFTSSLQNFWSGRWNLMVNRILRPTVYDPVLHFWADRFGRRWAAFPAVMSTFAVSGLMHELMFYYLGRVKPTWEITLYFVLHGSCLAVEIGVKKKLKGRYQPPRFVAATLSLGFLIGTGFWLFFPQLLRCRADAKAVAEYANVGLFLKDLGRALNLGFE